jgi:predicted ATPase with chaperone activity
MLARTLPSLLPDLRSDAALEVAAISVTARRYLLQTGRVADGDQGSQWVGYRVPGPAPSHTYGACRAGSE